MRQAAKALLIVLSLFHSLFAVAGRKVPDCWSNKLDGQLNLMNDEVLEWKKVTPNQYKDRALVSGFVTRSFPGKKSHTHFEIQIGKTQRDVLEVVYNTSFGQLPKIETGMEVLACGDYITSNKQSGAYPPSPSGAIIHWVHFNPGDRDGGKHEHGFLTINNELYGDEYPKDPKKKAPFLFVPFATDWSQQLIHD